MIIHEEDDGPWAWTVNPHIERTTAYTENFSAILDYDGIFFASSSSALLPARQYEWAALLLVAMVIAGVVGNGLVCAAIAVERKLRNDTNYFLVSLAIADLFVSLVVMPCCIAQEFVGNFGLLIVFFWLTRTN
jgi:hypothetical protein